MVLAPNKDEPDLADENEFTYESDPKGFACPYGSHVRRANPRASFVNDTPDESFKKSNRHRIIRRAVNYEDRPLFNRAMLEKREVPTALKDDGSRRGVHFFVINVSFRQQFELVQQTWCNKGSFNALFDTKDPIVGDNDGTGYMSIERRPVRKRLAGVPRFVIVRGGGYYFLPGVTALRYLAASRSPARRPEVDAGIPERSIWSELRQKSAKTVGLFLGLLTARW